MRVQAPLGAIGAPALVAAVEPVLGRRERLAPVHLRGTCGGARGEGALDAAAAARMPI